MKIGDRRFVRGYIDEIRKDTVIVRNDGGYFGTIPSEVTGGLPSAQPEITTCIDCIHYIPLGKDKAWGRCSVHSSPTENQRMCQSCDFCAWAERRTDGRD